MKIKSLQYQHLVIYLSQVKWPILGRELVKGFLLNHKAASGGEKVLMSKRVLPEKTYFSREQLFRDLDIDLGPDLKGIQPEQGGTMVVIGIDEETKGENSGPTDYRGSVTTKRK